MSPKSDAVPELLLRAAGASDAALIASMHARSWAATYRGLLPPAYLDHEMPGERSRHWQATLPTLAGGAGTVLIAELGGEPVGFVCVLAPDDHGSALVDNLHALPGYKGAGIGTRLLDAARDWALAQGAGRMHLYALDGNRGAIGFYESRGWQFAGSEADQMAGIAVTSLRYELPLDGR